MARIEVKSENQDAATDAATTTAPATDAATTTAPVTDDESALKAKLAEMQKLKDEQNKHIAELQANIIHAEDEVKKYAGIMSGTSEMDVMIQTLVKQQDGKIEAINAAPDVARKALADYRLSILSPAEKLARENWNKAELEVKGASDKLAALRAEITAKYPEFFGTVKVATSKVKKEGGAVATPSRATPFTGTLNSKEADEIAIKAIFQKAIADGTPTNETIILKQLYPGDYTLSGSLVKTHRHLLYMKYAKEFGVWTGA